jgi:hypothetical protein
MTIISSGPWLYGYDTKIELWCAWHKDRPEEEWNAYTRVALEIKIAQFEDPDYRNPINVIRQVVRR